MSAFPQEIVSVQLMLNIDDGHCGVTLKSIPWFFGGRTFIEIIEPGSQLPDVSNGITEVQRVQLGDFVVSVDGVNVENYTTKDISMLILDRFALAVTKGKDFIRLAVWRNDKQVNIVNRPLLASAPRLAYGPIQLMHIHLLRCETFAFSAIHLPEVQAITDKWLFMNDTDIHWTWPCLRNNWRKRLISACESGIFIKPKELGKMIEVFEEAFETLLPPVNLGFATPEDMEEAYEKITFRINSTKNVGPGFYLKRNFGFFVDFNVSNDTFPKPFEWKKEFENVKNYTDTVNLLTCVCTEVGRRIINAFTFNSKLLAIEDSGATHWNSTFKMEILNSVSKQYGSMFDFENKSTYEKQVNIALKHVANGNKNSNNGSNSSKGTKKRNKRNSNIFDKQGKGIDVLNCIDVKRNSDIVKYFPYLQKRKKTSFIINKDVDGISNVEYDSDIEKANRDNLVSKLGEGVLQKAKDLEKKIKYLEKHGMDKIWDLCGTDIDKEQEKKSLEKIESMKAKRGTYAQKMKKAAAVPSTGKKGPKTRWLNEYKRYARELREKMESGDTDLEKIAIEMKKVNKRHSYLMVNMAKSPDKISPEFKEMSKEMALVRGRKKALTEVRDEILNERGASNANLAPAEISKAEKEKEEAKRLIRVKRAKYWENQMQQNEDAIKEEYRKVKKRRDEKLQKEKLNVYRNANGTVVEVFKRRKDEYFRGVIEFQSNKPGHEILYGIIVYLNTNKKPYDSGPIYETRYEAALQYDFLVRNLLGVKLSEGFVNFSYNSSLRVAPFNQFKYYSNLRSEKYFVEDTDTAIVKRYVKGGNNNHIRSLVYCPISGKGFDNELAFGEYFITTHMEVQNIKTQKLQENSLLGNTLSTVFTKNAKNVGYNSNFPSANQLMHYPTNKKATTITLSARKFKSSSQKSTKIKLSPRSSQRKSFPCTVCNAVLMSRDSFKKHMYVQHQGGRESWQCHMCKSVLGSKDSLKRHYRHVHQIDRSIIMVEDGHQCDICKLFFGTNESLVKHKDETICTPRLASVDGACIVVPK